MNEGTSFFVIAGAQRCGTSYLYSICDQHPEIAMAKPVKPEPKFFLKNKNPDAQEYLNAFFKHREQETVLGEKSTSYVEFPDITDTLLGFDPHIKVIISLRNPIERALSNYFFSVQNGLENRTLEETFIDNREPPQLDFNPSVSPFAYMERSFYSQYVTRFIENFKNDQVKVLIFEELHSSHTELEALWQFLGVETRSPVQRNEKVNAANQALVPDEERLKSVKQYLQPYFLEEIQFWEDYLGKDLNLWYI